VQRASHSNALPPGCEDYSAVIDHSIPDDRYRHRFPGFYHPPPSIGPEDVCCKEFAVDGNSVVARASGLAAETTTGRLLEKNPVASKWEDQQDPPGRGEITGSARRPYKRI